MRVLLYHTAPPSALTPRATPQSPRRPERRPAAGGACPRTSRPRRACPTVAGAAHGRPATPARLVPGPCLHRPARS